MQRTVPREKHPVRKIVGLSVIVSVAAAGFAVGAGYFGPYEDSGGWRYLAGVVFAVAGLQAVVGVVFAGKTLRSRIVRRRAHTAIEGLTSLAGEPVDGTIVGTEPLLVDFWADWCVPCKVLEPVLEEVARALEGRVRVAKLDVEAHGEASKRLGVLGLPTLILFRDGRERTRLVGAGRGKEKILKALEPYLS